MHSRSQDKLDKDDPDKEKKDKKKEKRNSKHQELFDKEFKPTDISLQQSEAVILSETVISQGTFLLGRSFWDLPWLPREPAELSGGLFIEFSIKQSHGNLGSTLDPLLV